VTQHEGLDEARLEGTLDRQPAVDARQGQAGKARVDPLRKQAAQRAGA
jgi:hypothetical protein